MDRQPRDEQRQEATALWKFASRQELATLREGLSLPPSSTPPVPLLVNQVHICDHWAVQ